MRKSIPLPVFTDWHRQAKLFTREVSRDSGSVGGVACCLSLWEDRSGARVSRWAGFVFSYMGTSLKPGFSGAGLALESVVMCLGPRFWVYRDQPGTRDQWVGRASESVVVHWEHWTTSALGACRCRGGARPGLEEIQAEPGAEEAAWDPWGHLELLEPTA